MKHEQEARTRIINTATALFHKQGYHATGINQIIKEAHVAKASLYYHFATKEDLCVAFLKERNTQWSTRFYHFAKDKNDKVLAAFDFLMEDNEVSDFRGCSFLNILSETSEYREKIFEQLQHHKRQLLLFFESEIEDPALAYTIYSLFENAIIESQLFRNQDPVIKLKKIARELLETHH